MVKVLVPAAITLILGLTGVVVTRQYNDNQLRIARTRDSSDVEIARVNAALSYVNTIKGLASDSERREALAVAVSVLPPDVAFDLAVRNLPSDSKPLVTLIRKYGEASWPYLEPFLEVKVERVGISASYVDALADGYSAHLEDRREQDLARDLLGYLQRAGYVGEFYAFLLSPRYKRPGARANALFHYYRALTVEDDKPTPSVSDRLRYRLLVQQSWNDSALDMETKSAIALAGCAAFSEGDGDLADQSLELRAAEFYWNDLDVEIGQVPTDLDIRALIYRTLFVYKHADSAVAFPGVLDSLSASLRRRLSSLPWRSLSPSQVQAILYSYAEETPNGAPTPYSSYLRPKDSRQIVIQALAAADTPERRRSLATHFGSLAGDVLFRNVARDSTEGRLLALELIQWYQSYYAADWQIPKFFATVATMYPEYKSKIRDAHWGVGLE